VAQVPESGRVEIAVCDNVVYVKAVGKCLQKQGIALHEFASAMRKAGCREVILDLNECAGMDSTFMGTVMSMKTSFQDADGLKVINMNPACEKQLKGVGLLALLDVSRKAVVMPHLRLKKLGDPAYGALERMEIILKLHKELVEQNPDLNGEFGPCIEAIEQEIDERKRDGDGKAKS